MVESLGFESKPAKPSKFLLKIVEVPNILGDEDLMEHLSRRDPRFKDRILSCIVERFRMNGSHDTIVFQALNPFKNS